ncbi:MAG: sodium:glutamate symporter [bacterium]|nr:sodium:glutamate symporter [bacterium]
MPFTPWSFFTDLGLIAILLLVGQLIRAKVVFVQRLFLPANLIAGLLALLLGPNGFSILPFSQAIGTYPGILIALIFASLPFTAGQGKPRSGNRRAAELWAYSTLTMCFQWGLGLLFALTFLRFFWPELHTGFGAILASGFVGGHGTAAAVGSAFAARGWNEAGPLAMTSATIGILSAIAGGMAWISWGVRNGHTRFVAPFKNLPEELRTGLIPEDKRPSLGQETVSSIAIDPLVFHFALIAATSVLGYFIGQATAHYFGAYRLPTFCLAFLAAVGFKQVLKSTGADTYIDRKSVLRICGSLTDLLVAFGIAAIQIPILLKYAYPLLALFAFGLILCWALFRYLGPRMFHHLWFEKSLYTWGWVTGIMAMAIALLRIVDPETESHILDDFALSYLAIGPIEVLLVTLSPILISQGHHWALSALTIAAGILILILSLITRNRRNHPDPQPHTQTT